MPSGRITDVNGDEIAMPYMDDQTRKLFWIAMASPPATRGQAIGRLCRHVYFQTRLEDIVKGFTNE